MASTTSTKVPKGWEAFHAGMTAITDRFCREHLNEEYAEFARYAITALCCKRPSPLASGNPQTWACAILYALGQVNFLSDKSSRPHMAMADLCARFGIAPSTGGNKARIVRDALGIRQFDHRWALPSLVAGNEMFWLVEVDGFPVDARRLPRDVQEQAARRGLIPYVWSGSLAAEGDEREQLLQRYDIVRELCNTHKARLLSTLLVGSGPEVAVRIGLAASVHDAQNRPPLALAPALDIAAHIPGADGKSPLQHDLDDARAGMTSREQEVMSAVAAARFGVFTIIGRHPLAGLVLRNVADGTDIWLVDRSLEQAAPKGVHVALWACCERRSESA
jgi:hypothetical protein